MITKSLTTFLAALVCVAISAQAQISINVVSVGDPGNPGQDRGSNPPSGSVGYSYQIGQTEISNSQYVAFLNAAAKSDPYQLYNPSMSSSGNGGIERTGADGSYIYSVKSGMENRPVNYVSFWDAARFTNWLTNGQPSNTGYGGATEHGGYTLNNLGSFTGNYVLRNSGSNLYFVTSANEWSKAAFYNPATQRYWGFPTQQYAVPSSYYDLGSGSEWSLQLAARPAGELPPGGANSANVGRVAGVLDVGSYPSSTSAYGTLDQYGNLSEWLDDFGARSKFTSPATGYGNVYTGPSFDTASDVFHLFPTSYAGPDSGGAAYPEIEAEYIGFRITYISGPYTFEGNSYLEATAVPETSTYGAILGGFSLGIVFWMKRSRKRDNSIPSTRFD